MRFFAACHLLEPFQIKHRTLHCCCTLTRSQTVGYPRSLARPPTHFRTSCFLTNERERDSASPDNRLRSCECHASPFRGHYLLRMPHVTIELWRYSTKNRKNSNTLRP